MTHTRGNVAVELLFVGNELLIGKVLNTNSQWLARNITLLGGTCTRMTVVGDDLEEIETAVKEILDRSPRFLIITGGLGPTFDDMTLEGVSRALKRPLQIDEKALSWIKRRYRDLYQRGLLMDPRITQERRKMAMLPINSKALPNPVGTAPGILMEEGSTKFICLPGIPKEVMAIFNVSVKKELVKETEGIFFIESGFVVEGLGESTMAPMIREARDRYEPDIYIKSHPKGGRPIVAVEFHLTSRGEDEGLLKQRLRSAEEFLKERIEVLGGKLIPLNKY